MLYQLYQNFKHSEIMKIIFEQVVKAAGRLLGYPNLLSKPFVVPESIHDFAQAMGITHPCTAIESIQTERVRMLFQIKDGAREADKILYHDGNFEAAADASGIERPEKGNRVGKSNVYIHKDSIAHFGDYTNEGIFHVIPETKRVPRIGYEIEKEDGSAKSAIAKMMRLFGRMGFAIKSDGSLNGHSGFEFVTPSLPLDNTELAMRFLLLDPVVLAASAKSSKSCGGHIHVSDVTRKTRLIDDVRGWWPALVAFSPRRALRSGESSLVNTMFDSYSCVSEIPANDVVTFYNQVRDDKSLSIRRVIVPQLNGNEREYIAPGKSGRGPCGIINCGRDEENHIELRMFETPSCIEDVIFRYFLIQYVLAHPIKNKDEESLTKAICNVAFYRLLRSRYSAETIDSYYKLVSSFIMIELGQEWELPSASDFESALSETGVESQIGEATPA